jgi:hypothetical protein
VRRLLLLLLPLLLVAAPAPAHAVEADTGLGIRLLEAPTDRRDDPRALVYVIDHVGPGESFTRRIEVSNDTPEPMAVDLYSVGSDIVGSSFSPLAGRTPNELSTWTTVSPERLQLAPREQRTATVTVTVPDDASEGERYAAVMAESAAIDADGVVVNTRVGIRVYLSVGPGGEPASDFTIDDLRASRDERGQPVVEATVTNTGGRALDMSGSLSLTEGPGGLSAGPFPAELGTTLGVGESQPVRVVLDKALPAGPWKARIDLKSGLLERAAEGALRFPDAVGEVGPRVVAEPVPLTEDFNVLVPIALGLIGLVLVSMLLLHRMHRVRHRRDQMPAPAAEVPAPRRSADDRVVS